MTDVTNRLFLRQTGSAASGDSVLLSTAPVAGSVPLRDSNGMTALHFSATFFQTNVAAAASDAKLTGDGTYPQFVVAAGWTAYLYLWTLQTYDDGTDITSCSVKLWIANQDVGLDALTVVPDNNGVVRASASLPAIGSTPPYTVTAQANATTYFDPRVTTNGSAGTMNVRVTIFGFLLPNS